MALIKCPKCGKEISDKAANCVGCGWKVESIKDSTEQHTTKLQYKKEIKKEKNLPSASIFFMIISVFVMLCFMIVIWRKIDRFSKEIELIALSNQTESKMVENNSENVVEEKPENINDDLIVDEENIEENNTTELSETEDSDVSSVTGSTINSENDSRIQVSFDLCKDAESSYPELIFTVKNNSKEDIKISVNQYQYLNDIAIRGINSYNENLPAGKASIVKVTIQKEVLSFSNINKIEFGCKSSGNNGNELNNSFIFDDLNINIK